MSVYSNMNNQTTRRIYNIIDDLEGRFSYRGNSRKKVGKNENGNYSNYNLDMTDNSHYYYRRPQEINDTYNYQNTNKSQAIPPNLEMNKSSEIGIRNLIKDELNSLILPYQNDITMLQNKINDISTNYQNENITLRNAPNKVINKEDILNEVKNILLNYITIDQYNNNNMELENKINTNKNNLNLNNN